MNEKNNHENYEKENNLNNFDKTSLPSDYHYKTNEELEEQANSALRIKGKKHTHNISMMSLWGVFFLMLLIVIVGILHFFYHFLSEQQSILLYPFVAGFLGAGFGQKIMGKLNKYWDDLNI